jgi:hypothetical protein
MSSPFASAERQGRALCGELRLRADQINVSMNEMHVLLCNLGLQLKHVLLLLLNFRLIGALRETTRNASTSCYSKCFHQFFLKKTVQTTVDTQF